MQKKVKGLLVTGIVLCAAGAGLFALGAGMGGSAYIGTADLNKIDAYANRAETITMEKTKTEGFHCIEAELQDTDLKILPSGDRNYYLSYELPRTERDDPVEYRVENGTMILSGSTRSPRFIQVDISFLSWLLGGREKPEKDNEIILYVPEDAVLEESRIKLDDGDLSLYHTSVKDCATELSDGDMEAENLMVKGSLEIENSYGDVELELAETCRDTLSMDLKTKYGEIEVGKDLEKTGCLTEKDDQASYEKTAGSSAGMLTVKSSDGDITVK